MSAEVLHGCSLEVLKSFPEDHFDSVVTDPPYGLKFMNKHWDYDVPSVELWREVFRVLKPGGHLLSFGGTRTYHRLASAVEDAGFEIRDQLQWLFGSGFPKSMDVSKAIDKAAGAEREVIGSVTRSAPTHAPESLGRGEIKPAGIPKLEYDLTAPATDDARTWAGWGTALKPANEPIVLARKPLKEKTVAKNVLKHGTGALNIDASRIAHNEECRMMLPSQANIDSPSEKCRQAGRRESVLELKPNGRWPSNVILACICGVEEGPVPLEHLDDCAVGQLDKQSGLLQSRPNKNPRTLGEFWFVDQKDPDRQWQQYETAKGGASRFFYVAKTSKRERNAGLDGMPEKESRAYEGGQIASAKTPDSQGGRRTGQNHHPTVKPIKLMEYLIRLITPPGGHVLDPFTGSGSTGVAAVKLGFSFTGIEKELEYVEIARRRIEHV